MSWKFTAAFKFGQNKIHQWTDPYAALQMGQDWILWRAIAAHISVYSGSPLDIGRKYTVIHVKNWLSAHTYWNESGEFGDLLQAAFSERKHPALSGLKDKTRVEQDAISPQHRQLTQTKPQNRTAYPDEYWSVSVFCDLFDDEQNPDPRSWHHISFCHCKFKWKTIIWHLTHAVLWLLNGIPFIWIILLLLNVGHKIRENLKERGQENSDVKQPRDKPRQAHMDHMRN